MPVSVLLSSILWSFAVVSAAAAPAGDASSLDPAKLGHTREYRVRQTTTLDQIPSGSKLVRWWVSIPSDERYQDVLELKVVGAPGDWKIERDLERGNRFLLVEVREPTSDKLETVVEFVVRRQPVWIDVDPARAGAITAVHHQFYAEEVRLDAPHMAVDERITELADQICGPDLNPASQARKLLQYVADTVDHYSKDPSKPKCGIGDASDCLANLGGCCTDLHSLFIALARARGIPARLQMGYRLLEKNLDKEVDPGYRCWVEYFVPNYGWLSADIVEADAQGGLGPERWFSGLTERRVWLNEGREFKFGSATQPARVNTMIMGHAEIDGRVARVLPDGDLTPQLTRRVHFTELALPADAGHAQASPAPSSGSSSGSR